MADLGGGLVCLLVGNVGLVGVDTICLLTGLVGKSGLGRVSGLGGDTIRLPSLGTSLGPEDSWTRSKLRVNSLSRSLEVVGLGGVGGADLLGTSLGPG